MKNMLSAIAIVFVTSVSEAKTMDVKDSVQDSTHKPQLIIPDEQGRLNLWARHGYPLGERIKYMPEWDAYGYFNELGRAEWDVDVRKAGRYDVLLEWSAEGDVVGNPYIFEIKGGRKISGKVADTGSWEVFKTEKIGEIRLRVGKQRIVFRPDPKLKKGGMLDLRVLKLVPRN